jgi:hypothetical protein
MSPIYFPYQPFFVASSEFDPTESKILNFKSLQDGWHYQEGVAFSDAAIQDALLVHRQIFFKGFTRTDAFPGPNGEIQVTMYFEAHYFQFERESSSLWNITHEVDDKEVEFLEEKNISLVVDYINALNAKLCDTFDVYLNLIGTGRGRGSTTWRSNERKGAYLSWVRTVCSPLDPQFVST